MPMTYVNRGGDREIYFKSSIINIDNGAGATIDEAIYVPDGDVLIRDAWVVYTTETAGTVAAGNVKLGTTVGGAEIVVAAALTNSATIGQRQTLTLVSRVVKAGTPIIMRHTGVAATAAGQYFVQLELQYLN